MDCDPEHELSVLEPGQIMYSSLVEAIRSTDPNMEQIQAITSSPEAIAAMADPNYQEKLRNLIAGICKWRDHHPWQVIRCLLRLVTDFHAQDEWIACRMIYVGHEAPDHDDLISLLEEHRPNLLVRSIDLLGNYVMSLHPTLDRLCEGKSFQIWRGSLMRCIISEYSIQINHCLCFRLDHLFVCSRGIKIARDGLIGKLVPDWVRVAQLDQTTTEHQAILTLETDGVEKSFPVYIPDFLLPATINRKPRVKSARSAHFN